MKLLIIVIHFIFYDFYFKVKNIIKLNIKNINNSLINMYILNNYNNINNYIGTDILNLSNKYLYKINEALYNLITTKNDYSIIIKKNKYMLKIIENNTFLEKNKYTEYFNNDYILNNNDNKIKIINKNIIFFDIKNTSSGFNYYMVNMKKYYNIIKMKYNTNYREISLNCKDNFNKSDIKKYLDFTENDIFMLDDLTITVLIISHLHIKNVRDDIEYFINNAKYIICFSEIFITSDLHFTGCCVNNKEFVKLLFTKSITNLILNTVNLYYMYKNNIYNHIYFPSYGHSEINNICSNNIDNLINKEYDIDVLFYGNYLNNKGNVISKHRYDTINNIKSYSEQNNIIFKSYSYLYDEKDIILSKTKIVIHIAPTKNFHVFSWAKAVELMAKKIFFIVEDNEELYLKNIENIIPHYDRNNINDLYDKINYYLNNDHEREKSIELCYNYIKKKYDMDYFVINLLDQYIK